MKNILALSFLLLTGCASVEYSPYVGKQKEWPTADAAFVKTVRGIQIYHGLPSQPYEVLGEMTINTGPQYIDFQTAGEARARGAQAVILLDKGSLDVGAIHQPGVAVSTFTPYAATTTQTVGISRRVIRTIWTVYLIKFKTA